MTRFRLMWFGWCLGMLVACAAETPPAPTAAANEVTAPTGEVVGLAADGKPILRRNVSALAKAAPHPPLGVIAPVTLVDSPRLRVALSQEQPNNPRTFSAHGYLLLDTISHKAALIDAGWTAVEPVKYWLTDQGATLVLILLTHGHLDHTGGVAALKAAFPAALVAVSEADAAWMSGPDRYGFPDHVADFPPPPERRLRGGETLTFGATAVSVLATPGHTAGSLSYLVPSAGLLFSGDTLFYHSIGRVDMPHATSREEELRSIRQAYGPLPDDTRVLPGHGQATTLGEERQRNPFLASGASR